MCIRDSVLEVAVAARQVPFVGVPDALGRPEAGEDLLGGGAVSYTHLRAHETVLDLVCRLLLEKKKTQRQTHTTMHYKSNTKHRPTSYLGRDGRNAQITQNHQRNN